MTQSDKPTKARRGFAAMTPEQRSALSSRGGRAAHVAGTAHEWNAESARAAGRKGGLTTSADREEMARRGRKGGKALKKPRAGFTTIEALVVLVIIALLCIYPWLMWKLFQQTTVLGAIKWAAILISVSLGGVASKVSK